MLQTTVPVPVKSAASALVVSALVVAAGGAAAPAAADGPHDHGAARSHPVTTTSAEAQRLFDRGLGLSWGFNHLEAARAFRQATDEDPECAMCWWGLALVLGPNINAPFDPRYHAEIRSALDHAQLLLPRVSDRERAYIRALAERYGPSPVADRRQLDRTYARAMRRVAHAHPDDLDAGALFAEALMNTMPWDYWKPNREPRPGTREFLDILESVLQRDPQHSGANHLLIHAVEKTRPDLGVPAAERLEKQAQATGHLIHMASHIYIRVGRYDDAARVNEMAIADDDAYAREHEVPLEYVPYMLHNHHMRWAALTFSGRSDEAQREARYLAEHADPEAMRHPVFGPFVQHLLMVPVFDHIRFQRWDEILAYPEPPQELLYPRAIWQFARGVAGVRQNRVGEAETALAHLRTLAAAPELAAAAVNFNPVVHLLAIGTHTLAGEVAGAKGEWEQAVRHLREAVRLEDALTYDEPPPWLPPARNWLATLLLRAGRPAEAEQVFREDLEIYPRNTWSEAGLARSLEAQDRQAASPGSEDTAPSPRAAVARR